MFLNKTDLYVTILQDELTEITRNDDVLISNAISSAIAEMKVYLHDSYDTDAIFSASGQQRHGLLVNLGADMAVYFIVARCQAGQELADREARYKRAVKLLKAFESAETYADLPRRPQRAQKQIWFTSNRKRVNYFGGADDRVMPSNQVQQTSLPTLQIQRDEVPVVAPTNTIVGTSIYMVSDAVEILVNGMEVTGWIFTAPSTFLLPITLTTSDFVVIKRLRAVQSTV